MKSPIQSRNEAIAARNTLIFHAMQSAANEAEKSLRFANPQPSSRDVAMARHFAELGARHALSAQESKSAPAP